MSTTTATPDHAAGARNGGVPMKTAFIAAPSATAARALRKVLQDLGFVSLTTFEADQPGRTIPEITLDCLRRSELVIAVLADGPMNHNVFFELGLAHGLGKRILVIAEEKAVPTAKSLGDPYIRTQPDDAEAIGFAVRQLLAIPPSRNKPTEASAKQSHPIDGLADELLAELRGRKQPLTEEHLVRVIHRAIEGSGVTAASRGKMADARVDLAVWSDDLEPWVHNPLIIEVKSRLASNAEVKSAVQQVLRDIEKTRVSTALVLYQQGAAKALDAVNAPHILFMTVEDFLESLRGKSFGDVIRHLSNQSVNGMS